MTEPIPAEAAAGLWTRVVNAMSTSLIKRLGYVGAFSAAVYAVSLTPVAPFAGQVLQSAADWASAKMAPKPAPLAPVALRPDDPAMSSIAALRARVEALERSGQGQKIGELSDKVAEIAARPVATAKPVLRRQPVVPVQPKPVAGKWFWE
jgi:hypothetical protein